MGFTKEQIRALDAKGKVIVSASAGSGKTTVMIEKIIRLITSGVKVDEILAVTFTNKAAASMKEKLCKALIEEINKPTTKAEDRTALKKQLALVPTADISTIHAYCSKLIRSHFFVAGVDSNFRVIGGEDADGRALKGAALDELFEEGYENGEEAFALLLSQYFRKKKDNALRKVFLDSYNSLRDKADYVGYLKKTAEGYTEGDFEEVSRALFAYYQEKCRYYYELVEDELAYFRTIAKIAPKQITLCEQLMQWLEEYAGAADLFAAAAIPKPKLAQKQMADKDPEEKKKHVERLAHLRERIVEAFDKVMNKFDSREVECARFLASGKTAAAIAKYLLRFDEKYAAKKEERGVLDYNDLEHKALALLGVEEVAAEVQRKYRYVFVDEYQDVNPVQEKILSLLSGENVFLVGDIKQAIYGFRGSKSKFFAEKQEELASGAGESLFMKYNFRSASAVLEAVNAQFSLAMTKRVCSVDYARDSYMENGGRYAANSGEVKIYFTGKEKESPPAHRDVYSVKENTERRLADSAAAKRLAQIIQEEKKFRYLDDPSAPDQKRRVRYGDIAILTRKKAGDIEKEVNMLTALGFPVTTASPVNVCEFGEVKALIDILSLLDNAEQDIPLCSALLSGMGNLTADELGKIRLAYPKASGFRFACKKYAAEQKTPLGDKLRAFYDYLAKIRIEAQVLSVGEVLAKLLADTQMEAGLLARKNGRACLKRIRRFLEEASSFGGESVHDFLEYLHNLDYNIEYCENGGEDSIKVMTMHSSKGLEFPIVILPNLSQSFQGGRTPDVFVEETFGLAPHAFDEEKMLRHNTVLRRLFKAREERSSIADELNLYYVALTRAEQRLHLLFEEPTPVPDVRYAKNYADITDFSVWEKYVATDTVFDVPKSVREALTSTAEEREVEAIVRAFDWSYAHTGYENLPVKSSPTQLMTDGKYIPAQHFHGQEEEGDETEIERDLAVRSGTAYHAFLEHFDFALLLEDGKPVSAATLGILVDEALLRVADKVDCSLLDKEKLVEILSNPVFYGLEDARLYKEQQFLVALPVKDTYAKKEGMDPALLEKEGEEMLFQGAIDLLAVREDGVLIIDYKYSARGAEALKAHYAPQLHLYKLAVAKILRLPLDKIKCSIVNIRKGFQVDME